MRARGQGRLLIGHFLSASMCIAEDRLWVWSQDWQLACTHTHTHPSVFPSPRSLPLCSELVISEVGSFSFCNSSEILLLRGCSFITVKVCFRCCLLKFLKRNKNRTNKTIVVILQEYRAIKWMRIAHLRSFALRCI